MRVIISKIFRKKTPFDGLKEHGRKVLEGIYRLREAMLCYFDEKFDDFEKAAEDVVKIENEADWIKGNIRNHLPKGIFMPVDRYVFLNCLKEQDTILDLAEDIVVWLGFKKVKIADDFKEKLKVYVEMVVLMVEKLENLLADIKRLIVSISPSERKKIKKVLKDFHIEEEKTDKIEAQLLKNFFSAEINPMEFYYLTHIVFLLARIADRVENVSDNLRNMLAK